MKKIIVLLAWFFILTDSYATVNTIYPRLKASDIFFLVGKTGKTISLQELSEISVKNFQLLRNYKMDLFDRLSFSLAQKKARNMINPDGTISTSKMEKYVKHHGGQTGACIGGFFLGLVLGPLGLLLAYLSKDEKKHNRVIWAWVGLATLIAFWILAFSSGAWWF